MILIIFILVPCILFFMAFKIRLFISFSIIIIFRLTIFYYAFILINHNLIILNFMGVFIIFKLRLRLILIFVNFNRLLLFKMLLRCFSILFRLNYLRLRLLLIFNLPFVQKIFTQNCNKLNKFMQFITICFFNFCLWLSILYLFLFFFNFNWIKIF